MKRGFNSMNRFGKITLLCLVIFNSRVSSADKARDTLNASNCGSFSNSSKTGKTCQANVPGKDQGKIVIADDTSAIKIAEANLVKTYGENVLLERPFVARLEGDRWTIEGTLRCPNGKICKGGVAHIELRKSDGSVLAVSHGK
jgi:hypothetical protein